jgi:hypothetical protein
MHWKIKRRIAKRGEGGESTNEKVRNNLNKIYIRNIVVICMMGEGENISLICPRDGYGQ